MATNRPLIPAVMLLLFGVGGFAWTRSQRATPRPSASMPRGPDTRDTSGTTPNTSGPTAVPSRVRGRVVTASGAARSDAGERTPLPGAWVAITPLDRTASPTVVRAERDGQFSFYAPRGRYALSASAPGMEPGETAVVVAPTASSVELRTVVGSRGTTWSVQDTSGATLRDVVVRGYAINDLLPPRVPRRVAVSDIDGRFSAHLYDAPVLMEAALEGYAPVVHAVFPGADAKLRAVQLRRSGQISGRVLTNSGSVLEGHTTVRWRAARWLGRADGQLRRVPLDSGEVSTDPVGNFVVPTVPANSLVTLHAYNAAEASRSPLVIHLGDGEQRGPLALPIQPTNTLRGLARAAATDLSIPGAEVTVRSRQRARSATADDAGVFRIAGFEDSPATIEIHDTALGRRPMPLTSRDPASMVIMELPTPNETIVQLESGRAGTLRVTPAAAAATGARTRGQPPEHLPGSQLFFFDDTGTASIPVAGAQTVDVEARDALGNIGVERWRLDPRRADPISLAVSPTASITGRLVDPEDRPRARAVLSLTVTPPTNAESDESDEDNDGLAPPTGRHFTLTDQNGRFAFQHVPRGDVTLAAWSRHGVPIALDDARLAHDPRDVTAPIKLTTTDRSFVASFMLLDERGDALENAFIELIPSTQDLPPDELLGAPLFAPLLARTDERGRVSMVLPRGQAFHIVAEDAARSRGANTPAFEPGEFESIVLSPYGIIEISSASDRPRAQCERLTVRQGHTSYTIDDPFETVTLSRLIPGAITMTAQCPSGPVTTTLEVAQGAVQRASLMASPTTP